MNDTIHSRIIYPAVFTPSGIEFDLPADALVTVTITDAGGELMATPVNRQPYGRGTHEVVFTIPSKQRGNLFYRIVAETENGTLTERKQLR